MANIDKKAAPNLVLNAAHWKKVGIAIDTSADAVKYARQSLIDNGATNLPDETDKEAATAMVVMSTVQDRMNASKNAAREIAILLASMDASKEYAKVHDANGKPFTSVLALAKAWFPRLEHSTLAGYVGAGRYGYLPAARGEYGKAAQRAIGAMPANTIAVLRSALANDEKRDLVLEAVKKNPSMSKKAAQELIQEINGKSKRKPRTADESTVNAAAAAEQLNNADTYAKCQAVVKAALVRSAADGEINVTVREDGKAGLKRMIQEALVNDDAGYARAALRALMHGIYG